MFTPMSWYFCANNCLASSIPYAKYSKKYIKFFIFGWYGSRNNLCIFMKKSNAWMNSVPVGNWKQKHEFFVFCHQIINRHSFFSTHSQNSPFQINIKFQLVCFMWSNDDEIRMGPSLQPGLYLDPEKKTIQN